MTVTDREAWFLEHALFPSDFTPDVRTDDEGLVHLHRYRRSATGHKLYDGYSPITDPEIVEPQRPFPS